MKKIVCTIFVAMLNMVAMAAMAFEPPVILPHDYFTITNLNSNDSIRVSATDIPLGGYTVNLKKGVYAGDVLKITYSPLPSIFTYQATWTYGWESATETLPSTGYTAEIPVSIPPSPFSNKFAVACNYYREDQSENSKTYTLYFPNVRTGHRITVKNSDASEVQVTYADYEEVACAGQRASVALYDIYGNLVSTGYLDALGMSTLSTKGKSGIYIVKVIMNNQVVFNQRIQVK